jgi:hypothetical protein
MLEKIIVVTLLVWAVYIAMQPTMIFEFVADWLEHNFPPILQKPMHSCVVCMGGVWGMFFYWLVYGGGVHEWLVVNIGVIGLNAIIVTLQPYDT